MFGPTEILMFDWLCNDWRDKSTVETDLLIGQSSASLSGWHEIKKVMQRLARGRVIWKLLLL